MLTRQMMLYKHRKLPEPKTVTLYALEDDVVQASQIARYSQVRPHTRKETADIFGPTQTKSCEISVFAAEIGDWEVKEYHVIKVVKKTGTEWWRVDSVTLEMMDTRYRCQCVPTTAVTE
jgi:hypothetical protein